MAYRSLWRFWQARHPPRYAAFTRPSSPRFLQSSLEAVGLDAMEDLATIADFVQDVALDGNEERLQNAEARWRLEQTLERAKARQSLLANGFSRRAVNARFRQNEHHVLMHQQL